MKAAVGDRVFVASLRPGHEHMGRVVALRHSDGTPPYVVRWDDTGAETLHFPREDCRIEPAIEAPEHSAPGRQVRHWTVDVDVVAQDQTTTAYAVLHEKDSATVVSGSGESVRRPGERNIPELGDELAVARALRSVSDTLVHAVCHTLTDIEHRHVDLVDLRPSRAVRLP